MTDAAAPDQPQPATPSRAGAPDRTCPICSREFQYPYEMRRHMKKKKACAPGAGPSAHTCRCGRQFASARNLVRHEQDHCSLRGGITAQLAELTAQVNRLAQKQIVGVETVHAEHSTVNINPSIHYHINHFGRENTDHITREDIRSILMEVRQLSLDDAMASATIRAALMIYSDPAHPENITCYLPSRTEPSAMIHGKYGWELQPVSLVLSPMFRRTLDELMDKQPHDGDVDMVAPVLRGLVAAETDGSLARRLVGSTGELRVILTRNQAFAEKLMASLGGILAPPPRMAIEETK